MKSFARWAAGAAVFLLSGVGLGALAAACTDSIGGAPVVAVVGITTSL
jgi:hypothetical protein